MDNCYINIGAVKTKDIDGELYISCWNFSKVLNEKEREISDLCKENDEQKKQISELESELVKKETLLKMREEFCKECKEKSAIEKLKETPIIEEPLPFSSDECEKETKTELPTMPIDVASMLINARDGIGDKYSKDDLQEIIEHLRVFIDNPSDY